MEVWGEDSVGEVLCIHKELILNAQSPTEAESSGVHMWTKLMSLKHKRQAIILLSFLARH